MRVRPSLRPRPACAPGYATRRRCRKEGTMEPIPPVLVLSTGRCGSTMISDVLNLHPDVLSLSEVFSLLGPLALFGKRLSGKAMWALCSRQNPALRVLLSADTIVSEILYPFGGPRARYDTLNVAAHPVHHAAPPDTGLRTPVRRARARRAGAPAHRPGGPVPVPVRVAARALRAPRLGRALGRFPDVRAPGCGACSRRRAWSTCTATGGTRRCR